MRSPAARPDTRLTYDDFMLFPDDGKRHEIIDGEHYVTLSPNLRHQELVGRLHVEIAVYLKAHPFERTGVREYWLVDPELDTVQVFRPSLEGKLLRVAELSAEEDETLTTPLLPGCAIGLRDLFRDAA